MLHIRGNSLSKSSSSSNLPSENPRIILRLNSEHSSINQIQKSTPLRISVHKPSLSLSSLNNDPEKRFFPVASSRFQKSSSMKTKLIQFNKKLQNLKQPKLLSRINNSIPPLNTHQIKHSKKSLEIFVYSQRYPNLHLNQF